MRDRLFHHTVGLIPIDIAVNHAHEVLLRLQKPPRPTGLIDHFFNPRISRVQKNMLLIQTLNKRLCYLQKLPVIADLHHTIEYLHGKIRKNLFRIVLRLVVFLFYLLLNYLDEVPRIDRHPISRQIDRTDHCKKFLHDSWRYGDHSVDSRSARLLIEKDRLLGGSRKIRVPIAIVQTPTGADLLYRLRRNDILLQLTVGIENAIDKEIFQDPIVNTQKRVTSDKSTRRPQFMVVLKKKQVFPRTISPEKFREYALTLMKSL